ncbi:MAG: chaperone NapD [Helicobacteraceae bacterium]
MNISSIIVKTKPEFLSGVIKDLERIEACEYFLSDELGRIIVTIEAPDVSEELKILKRISSVANVISADMHMSYSEEELEACLSELKSAPSAAPMLNDDTIDPKDIVYNGDLRKKF